MVQTFHLADTQRVKEDCLTRVNKNESFVICCVKNEDGAVHHWEIRDGSDMYDLSVLY